VSGNEGKVYLIGAGPGDPGLLTLRGAECLSRADVVLYDSLVNPQILQHASPDAELVNVGKHGRTRIWPQSEINSKLVELAQSGVTVARLKGGDPAVFARGAEEAEVLAAADIAFELVPGITAALAAGSYAGIPITHRDKASAVALVTGQENPDKDTSALDYRSLARFPGTLVFYMGVTTAPFWVRELIEAGKDPQTPAAVIRRCSYVDQRTISTTLAEVPELLHPGSELRPPCIVILGPVTELSATLSWFDQRPLSGQSVVVARPDHQAAGLADPLVELGAEVLIQPAIQIAAPSDGSAVDAVLRRLDDFDWLVFSSANGVRYLLDRLPAVGLDLRALGQLKLASIGPATSQELAKYHLAVDLQPAEYRAEALVESLREPAGTGARFLLARASRGREVLSEGLTEAGGRVEQVVVYQSDDVETPDPAIRERLQAGQIDWVCVTSSAIARSLVALFGDALKQTRLVSISPITSATLRELGYAPAAEASEYTMQGVVATIRSSQQLD